MTETVLSGVTPQPRLEVPVVPLAGRLSIVTDISALEPYWEALQERSAGSSYQNFGFLRAWCAHAMTVGRQQPAFGLVCDADGSAEAILPLVLERRGWGTVASYAGGSHSNLNFPLFARGVVSALGQNGMRDLLASYCRRAGADALALENQPLHWRGQQHPFADLPASPSVDPLLRIETSLDYVAYVDATLSRETRGKLRRKVKKAREGGLGLVTAGTPEEIGRILTAFLEQKQRRFASMGVNDPFDVPGVRQFLHAAALDAGSGFTLFGLTDDAGVHAVAGWLRRDTQASLMLLSYDTASLHARNSPGDTLIALILSEHLGGPVDHVDFGLGHERYKTIWSNEQTPMFDTILGATTAGKAWAAGRRAQTGLLRRVKANQSLYGLIKRVRARMAGQGG